MPEQRHRLVDPQAPVGGALDECEQRPQLLLGGNQRSRWRPFAAVGAGIVRTTIESTNLFPDRKDTEPVVEAGGGIQAFFFANAMKWS